MQLLSLVVPCFNEEATIQTFYDEVMKYEDRIDAELEFCFIDDGSTDRTIEILRDLHKKDSRVHYVSFSRNFGKEAGLYAGLSMAKGDYVATMDVDLQDPPALLPDMWRLLHDPIEDYDCVATKRTTRKGEPAIRSFFARQFYKIINKLSKTQIVDGARDFRMMSRQMVNAIVADGEYNRFSKGIFSWVGFKTKWLSYENIERSAGHTKWSFWKLFQYSIEGILAYTTIPLYLSSILGIAMCGVSFLALILIFLRALIAGDPVAGWPSLVCIITLLGGLVLMSLGVIGLYIAKIYLETKKRQLYIVREEE
ncbi:glycosyltransferase family 2 protein [Dialister hominis]|uniref:glycosyltransferase family 2 protein n=1 Tax=Dialister hominis TaxID=2582419 RepID=UPI004025DCC4